MFTLLEFQNDKGVGKRIRLQYRETNPKTLEKLALENYKGFESCFITWDFSCADSPIFEHAIIRFQIAQ